MLPNDVTMNGMDNNDWMPTEIAKDLKGLMEK